MPATIPLAKRILSANFLFSSFFLNHDNCLNSGNCFFASLFTSTSSAPTSTSYKVSDPVAAEGTDTGESDDSPGSKNRTLRSAGFFPFDLGEVLKSLLKNRIVEF